MKPSQKISDFLEQWSGRTKNNKCINPPLGCGRVITDEQLLKWDRVTLKEYTISGLCDACQRKVFT